MLFHDFRRSGSRARAAASMNAWPDSVEKVNPGLAELPFPDDQDTLPEVEVHAVVTGDLDVHRPRNHQGAQDSGPQIDQCRGNRYRLPTVRKVVLLKCKDILPAIPDRTVRSEDLFERSALHPLLHGFFGDVVVREQLQGFVRGDQVSAVLVFPGDVFHDSLSSSG
ncbi:hypothetical protein [Thermobifida cellulosilytica]|uniref:hypothetical protein n=1 Tax=Thermobifida cellulosilytica TaxID=144786 RepID=UPI0018DAFB54|nr:hypothetical protein [Thermobifida cellulosilytica]